MGCRHRRIRKGFKYYKVILDIIVSRLVCPASESRSVRNLADNLLDSVAYVSLEKEVLMVNDRNGGLGLLHLEHHIAAVDLLILKGLEN